MAYAGRNGSLLRIFNIRQALQYTERRGISTIHLDSTGYRHVSGRFTPDPVVQKRLLSSKPPSLLTVSCSGTSQSFDTMWLRDNCRCSECINVVTGRRTIQLKDLNETTTKINNSRYDDKSKELFVEWTDGHKSEYCVKQLIRKCRPPVKKEPEKVLWNAPKMREMQPDIIPYSDFMKHDESVKVLIRNVLAKGLCFVSGVSATVEDTEKVGERFAIIEKTIFGTTSAINYMPYSSDEAQYTHEALGGHTDASYVQLPYGAMYFHMLFHNGEGGNTVLVDGFHAAGQLRQENPEAFNLLSKHDVPHTLWDRDLHYMSSLDKTLTVNRYTNQLERVRFNPYFRMPLYSVEQEVMGEYYEALKAIEERLTDPENQFVIKLQPGTVIFLDNWRMLHGRTSFTGRRELLFGYFSRDNFMSRAKALGVIQYHPHDNL